jgi:hypothetical protein
VKSWKPTKFPETIGVSRKAVYDHLSLSWHPAGFAEAGKAGIAFDAQRFHYDLPSYGKIHQLIECENLPYA